MKDPVKAMAIAAVGSMVLVGGTNTVLVGGGPPERCLVFSKPEVARLQRPDVDRRHLETHREWSTGPGVLRHPIAAVTSSGALYGATTMPFQGGFVTLVI